MEKKIDLTKKLHVLFVDDEYLIREMIFDVLGDTVGHITLAKNGQEGLETYLNSLFPIDIVITDQTMPVMNGLDMLEKIKEHNPAQMCIMITAHSETKYMLRAIELGIDNFIVKPIDFDKLDEIVYDLALKIEQKNILRALEDKQRHSDIKKALDIKTDEILNLIPFPSLYIDGETNIILNFNKLFSELFYDDSFLREHCNLNDILIRKEKYIFSEKLSLFDTYSICIEEKIVAIDIDGEEKEFFMGMNEKNDGYIVSIQPKGLC